MAGKVGAIRVLTVEQVDEAYKRQLNSESVSKIAATMGVSYSTLRAAIWRRHGNLPSQLRTLTEAQLDEVYKRVLAGESVSGLAKEIGVNTSSLSRLLRRRFDFVPTPFWSPTLTLPDNPGLVGYIAGLVDGEGSIVRRNDSPRGGWCVTISLTHRETIDWLVSWGGRLTSTGKANDRNRLGNKPVWRWMVARQQDVVALLRAIIPYLIVKQDKAQRALQELTKET